MVTAILPEPDLHLKTPEIDGLARPPEAEPTSREVSLMIVMGLSGITSLQILADQSDEEDTLRQRLTAARPVLEMLDRMFNVDQLTSQGIR
jgi:hypothetical protein